MRKYSIGILLALLTLLPNSVFAESLTSSAPVTWNTGGQGSISIQVTAITGGGTITFYCTVDNSNFVAYNLTPVGGSTPTSTTATNGIWSGPLGPCNQFKLTISAGSATVNQRTIQNVKSSGGGSGGGGSGTVTSIATSSPITGGTITGTGTIGCATCVVAAAGSNTNIQYNNSTAFGADSNFDWVAASGLVIANRPITASYESGNFTSFFGKTSGLPSFGIRVGANTAEFWQNTAINSGSPAVTVGTIIDQDSSDHSSSTGLNGSLIYLSDVSLNGYTFASRGHIDDRGHTLTGAATGAFFGEVILSGILTDEEVTTFYSGITLDGSGPASTNGPSVTAFWSSINNEGIGTYDFAVHYYASEFFGSNITNRYYSWYDARGVGRCKEDDTFNSANQVICGVYNPQFTKYTAGLANFERIIYGQWSSNVGQIGIEAGGTGTLRTLQLIGGGLSFGSSLVTPASSGTRFLCISTTGVVTSSAAVCAGT